MSKFILSAFGDEISPELDVQPNFKKGLWCFLSNKPRLVKFAGFTGLEGNPNVSGMQEGKPKLFALAAKVLIQMLRKIQAEE